MPETKMTAGFSDVRVRERQADGTLEIACRILNTGQEVWSAGKGFAFSYQVFDPVSDTLIQEGARTLPERDIVPGDSLGLALPVKLPPEPGRYRVYVSPLEEHRAWFYEKNSPFLLVDCTVQNGQPRVERCLIATLRRVRRERTVRTLGRALWYPFRSLFRNRSLIRSMVRRDIAGRYRGSHAGLFWTVIHPLLMMLTYYFVFGIVLHTRFGSDERPSSFLLYFLAGMLPWLALSEAVGRASSVIIDYRTFVKKLVFPVEILPVNLAVAGLVSEAFGILIFAAGMAYFRRPLALTVSYLPLLVIAQLLLTLGLCWFLAALGVFFRDAGQLIGFLLTLWFFVTPICYPETALPAGFRHLFALNPLYILVRDYRRIFLESSAPEWLPLASLTAFGATLAIAGHAWFYKLRRSFADLL